MDSQVWHYFDDMYYIVSHNSFIPIPFFRISFVNHIEDNRYINSSSFNSYPQKNVRRYRLQWKSIDFDSILVCTDGRASLDVHRRDVDPS